MLKAIAGVRQKVRGAEIKRCKLERRKLERCGAKLKVRGAEIKRCKIERRKLERCGAKLKVRP